MVSIAQLLLAILYFTGWSTILSVIADHRFACKPGEMFKYNCSSCQCSSDGKSARCSVLPCEPGTTTSEKPEVPRNFLCEPKATFKQGCNYCFCNEDGRGATCTANPCPDTKIDENRFRCDAGKIFRRDCHNCICSSDGKSASCTLLPWCKSRPREGPGDITTGKTPEEEETDGSEVIDLQFKCQPGEVFKKNCNVCICGKDGESSSCTLSKCPKVDQEFRCQPGETFRQDCNSCMCSDDGRTASCTASDCVRLPYEFLNVPVR